MLLWLGSGLVSCLVEDFTKSSGGSVPPYAVAGHHETGNRWRGSGLTRSREARRMRGLGLLRSVTPANAGVQWGGRGWGQVLFRACENFHKVGRCLGTSGCCRWLSRAGPSVGKAGSREAAKSMGARSFRERHPGECRVQSWHGGRRDVASSGTGSQDCVLGPVARTPQGSVTTSCASSQ